MHVDHLKDWQHHHSFSVKNQKGERRTLYVLVLTAVTMVVEIAAGSFFGSMALLADGWHMGTHVAAFLIAVFAYRYARKHEDDPAYAFGTGKVNVLGGFASAVALAVVALVMVVESIHRIIDPQIIRFNESIMVAVVGLCINIYSAFLLRDDHTHEHHHHHDHNLRAAYLHVLADALTSLLAIFALVSGKFLGWNWLDPVMGIVGAMIITKWSFGLLTTTAPVLLDASIDSDHGIPIKKAIEDDSDNRISDFHVWRVGPNDYAAIISIVTHDPKPVEYYKELLQEFKRLSHVTIEVNQCPGEPCVTQKGID